MRRAAAAVPLNRSLARFLSEPFKGRLASLVHYARELVCVDGLFLPEEGLWMVIRAARLLNGVSFLSLDG